MKPFEYFVVQASGEFLVEYFPSEDMSEEEMLEYFIGTVCEEYEYTHPEALLQMIHNLAYTLQDIYTMGYNEGVESFNQ
jgi:hypothetical protein